MNHWICCGSGYGVSRNALKKNMIIKALTQVLVWHSSMGFREVVSHMQPLPLCMLWWTTALRLSFTFLMIGWNCGIEYQRRPLTTARGNLMNDSHHGGQANEEQVRIVGGTPAYTRSELLLILDRPQRKRKSLSYIASRLTSIVWWSSHECCLGRSMSTWFLHQLHLPSSCWSLSVTKHVTIRHE